MASGGGECYIGRMATQIKQPHADDDEALWAQLEREVHNDDGSVAREHLAAGRAIYIAEADTPAGQVIKLFPDGRRSFVRFDAAGNEQVVVGAA